MATSKDKVLKIVCPPMDFYNRFKSSIDDAIRDIGGFPVISLHPLFDDPAKLSGCIDNAYNNPFDDRTLTIISEFKPDPEKTYYMHLDGSEGGDGYGIAMSSLNGWKKLKEEEKENIKLPVVKVDLVGAPNRKTYGKDFTEDLMEDVIRDLVDRGFKIGILTYDRATNIRVIREIVEPQGTIVAPMSIDKCSSYPIYDFEKEDPPFFKKISTNGEYDKPMVEFSNLVNKECIILPYHEGIIEIPYSFEHNRDKKIVKKVANKQDDLGQAIGGSIFHVINNEKEFDKVAESKWEVKEEPDRFESQIQALQIENERRLPSHDHDKNFDRVPDEIEADEDDFYNSINSRYRI